MKAILALPLAAALAACSPTKFFGFDPGTGGEPSQGITDAVEIDTDLLRTAALVYLTDRAAAGKPVLEMTEAEIAALTYRCNLAGIVADAVRIDGVPDLTAEDVATLCADARAAAGRI